MVGLLWIERNSLVDLGFFGPQFIWCNNHHGGAKVWKRIEELLLELIGFWCTRDIRFSTYQDCF